MNLKKRMIAFRGRCLGRLGRLMRHPMTTRLVISVLGSTLAWLMKIGVVALFSTIGIALPIP